MRIFRFFLSQSFAIVSFGVTSYFGKHGYRNCLLLSCLIAEQIIFPVVTITFLTSGPREYE